jgi:hypothetical protein
MGSKHGVPWLVVTMFAAAAKWAFGEFSVTIVPPRIIVTGTRSGTP